jgi:hypothetical protein
MFGLYSVALALVHRQFMGQPIDLGLAPVKFLIISRNHCCLSAHQFAQVVRSQLIEVGR